METQRNSDKYQNDGYYQSKVFNVHRNADHIDESLIKGTNFNSFKDTHTHTNQHRKFGQRIKTKRESDGFIQITLLIY